MLGHFAPKGANVADGTYFSINISSLTGRKHRTSLTAPGGKAAKIRPALRFCASDCRKASSRLGLRRDDARLRPWSQSPPWRRS